MKNNCGCGCGMQQPRMAQKNAYASMQRTDCSKDCGESIEGFPPGMCYVPMQKWGCVFEADEGLANGTMFKELALPFTCAGCVKCCNDRRQVRR